MTKNPRLIEREFREYTRVDYNVSCALPWFNALLCCIYLDGIQITGSGSEDLMTDTSIINEMKRHTVSIKAKHNNVTRFVKVARSFVYKDRKELDDKNGDELTASRKKKQEHCQRSTD
ncbi:hypothetical protein ACTXT7_007106 [Hymenolepis weldensis]